MTAPRYASLQHEHDQRPLRIIPNTHVPGVRRPRHVAAGPEVRVGDFRIPTDSDEFEDGTTVDLPDDEPVLHSVCGNLELTDQPWRIAQ